MVELNDYLYKYKDWIILGSLLIGFLAVADLLPLSTSIINLGSNIKFLWFFLIALSAYIYYIFVAKNTSSSFQRTVKTRNISNPIYQRNLEEQRTGTGKGSLINKSRRSPGSTVRDRFNRE